MLSNATVYIRELSWKLHVNRESQDHNSEGVFGGLTYVQRG